MTRPHRTTPAERLGRRYRRLLWAYPSAYRAERGDEIVGVLLDCAEPGRSRPSVADAFDLTQAGLAARVRHREPARRTPWRDALAILTVVLPILLAADVLLQPLAQVVYRNVIHSYGPGAERSLYVWLLDGWMAPVAWLVVVVLLLGRKPRLAFVASVVATTLAAVHILQTPIAYQTPVTEAIDTLAIPVVATLLLSSASRARAGLELVGRRGARVAVVAACLLQLVPVAVGYSFGRIGVLAIELGMGADLMALVTLLAIATAVARRTGPDVAHRVAVAGIAIASFLFASLLIRWAATSTPLHKGDLGIVLVFAAVVPVALVGVARRVPRLFGNRSRSAHAA